MYNCVKIKKINAQKVSIEGFWSSLCNPITATVDFANSKLLIAPQVILTDDTYGDCDIASWVEKWYGLAIYRDKNIEVAINGNTLTFISNWGIFINSGSQADKYFEMSDNTVLTRMPSHRLRWLSMWFKTTAISLSQTSAASARQSPLQPTMTIPFIFHSKWLIPIITAPR